MADAREYDQRDHAALKRHQGRVWLDLVERARALGISARELQRRERDARKAAA